LFALIIGRDNDPIPLFPLFSSFSVGPTTLLFWPPLPPSFPSVGHCRFECHGTHQVLLWTKVNPPPPLGRLSRYLFFHPPQSTGGFLFFNDPTTMPFPPPHPPPRFPAPPLSLSYNPSPLGKSHIDRSPHPPPPRAQFSCIIPLGRPPPGPYVFFLPESITSFFDPSFPHDRIVFSNSVPFLFVGSLRVFLPESPP